MASTPPWKHFADDGSPVSEPGGLRGVASHRTVHRELARVHRAGPSERHSQVHQERAALRTPVGTIVLLTAEQFADWPRQRYSIGRSLEWGAIDDAIVQVLSPGGIDVSVAVLSDEAARFCSNALPAGFVAFEEPASTHSFRRRLPRNVGVQLRARGSPQHQQPLFSEKSPRT
jgi:hypothetical protein